MNPSDPTPELTEIKPSATDAPAAPPTITFAEADALLYAETNPPLAFDDGGRYQPGDTFQFGEARYEVLSVDEKTGRYRCEGTLPNDDVKSHLYVSQYELHTMLKAAEAMPFKAELNTLKVQNHQLAKTVTERAIANHDLECQLKTAEAKRLDAEKQLEQVKAEMARNGQAIRVTREPEYEWKIARKTLEPDLKRHYEEGWRAIWYQFENGDLNALYRREVTKAVAVEKPQTEDKVTPLPAEVEAKEEVA